MILERLQTLAKGINAKVEMNIDGAFDLIDCETGELVDSGGALQIENVIEIAVAIRTRNSH